MTAFVLDASVTAAWLLPDAASDHTRRLYTLIRRDEVEPQAPNLWHWECHNILASGVNSGRIPAASVEGLWSVLEAIRHRVELHELAPRSTRPCWMWRWRPACPLSMRHTCGWPARCACPWPLSIPNRSLPLSAAVSPS